MRTMRSFAAELTSIADARHYSREVLAALSPDILDAVELLVSELTTNSVKHARSAFTLQIEQSAGDIRVEVHDTGPGHPRLASPQPWELTGRGLRIVALMSATWGIDELDDGKTVWFTIATGALADGSATRSLTVPMRQGGSSS